jgi:quercetin dioxygenase-like cupin family protein
LDTQDNNLQIQRWNKETAIDRSKLKDQMISEGYSVFEWSDPPGRYYTPHSHAEDQSHWIISGALLLRVNGEDYTLHAGDRDFLPAGTLHEAHVVGSEPVIYLIGAKLNDHA